jgi:hypothetical protein
VRRHQACGIGRHSGELLEGYLGSARLWKPATVASRRHVSRPRLPEQETAVSVFNTSTSHDITPVKGSARRLDGTPAPTAMTP